ncbi:hypothetical protein FNF27_05043 [Cafeteria roenbergensis]|uniref:Signal recognition particle SRP54 subunit M-domain domain-containing protein n=2 Tax=Cafeteria roenbergensis TaxID=33653 RepID=A0A5A8D649_CAFRO|nr:hypothetical protein FNF29_00668 [Cafeteria roenbergensis]KAA0159421.1 hypothetical protein FNF28_05864 [Cafeteria roenbergensis]KAA0161980.1 hypothetical protein FNF31_03557 [Cafeteria roenbergensis]KAA0173548.1 hypothetical protein FNF27_05043 [Cafeteria roenbergensis]|eukprot:KAA0157316.1 hypothetical protein FNF29_00668 [Cafeteria roenbergensis]
MSFWDGLTSKVEGYRAGQQAKKSDEIFKAQMDYMQRISVFTLGNFVEMMSEIKAQSGVEGWSKMFRTKEQQDQLEQVMIDVKVGEQLLPQELRNPTLVGRRQRLRMASDAGVDVAKVNAFFRNFEQTVSIHRWVQRRSSEGLPIPKTMDEFLRMSSTDSKGLSGMQGAKQGKGRGRLGMTSQLGW